MFSFKGERDYIHGPDIYSYVTDKLIAFDPEIRSHPLTLLIYKFSRRQCSFALSTETNSCTRPEDANVEFRFVHKGVGRIGWLIEGQQPINQRYEYSESNIFENTRFNTRRVELIKIVSNYSTIEVLVSMTKRLHAELFPEVEGRWIVTRLDVTRFLEDEHKSGLIVELVKNLGSKFTKSEIKSRGLALGFIFFSLVK
jgi:hypothetical protein